MPYYKGVHFEQAFHTEEDILAHNAATAAGEPAPVTPTPEPETEPELAVSVPDRLTPIVEPIVAVDAEPDPFPTFVPEPEPVTEPAPESDRATVVSPEPNVTPADTPDAKKKKSGRSRG